MSGCCAAIGPPTPLPADGVLSAEDHHRATEEVLLQQAASGAGVILGRAAAIVLPEHPGVLRVRLDRPPASRVAQGIRLGRIDLMTAEDALRQLDRMYRPSFGRDGVPLST